MPFRIAIAGKGGTGKTTLSSLLCRALIQKGVRPLLAVDADPNSCLAERMGLSVQRTIGQLREDIRADPGRIPAGISKSEWIENVINAEIAESTGFDMVVMGRQEGPDCYCYINNMLRTCLDKLAENYRCVVIDNEAGLEHLSRRTNGRVEVMLVVCEPTLLGARTAMRIRDIILSLELEIDQTFLLLNRASGEIPPDIHARLVATGLEIIGRIPNDPTVTQFEINQKSLLELPADSASAVEMQAIVERILERRTT